MMEQPKNYFILVGDRKTWNVSLTEKIWGFSEKTKKYWNTSNSDDIHMHRLWSRVPARREHPYMPPMRCSVGRCVYLRRGLNVEAHLAGTSHVAGARGSQRCVPLPGDAALPRQPRSGRHAGGGKHALARRFGRGGLRGSRSRSLQASRFQSHRIVQGQRHGCRGGARAAARDAPGGLRLHR